MTTTTAQRRFHFVGICGTGMGALAGALQALGHQVRGSDARVYPPMSDALAAWGIPVAEGYCAENLLPHPDVVVVGNVIRRDHVEAAAARDLGIEQISMPEAVARFLLPGHDPLVVVGTHGKTTSTAMAAYLLQRMGGDPGYLIGGLPVDLPGSFGVGAGRHFVLEGDEYDSVYFDKRPKFLHYRPANALLTNIEFDHADIYVDLAAVEQAFAKFVALLPAAGLLAVNGHESTAVRVAQTAGCALLRYGLDATFDWSAAEVHADAAGQHFTLCGQGRSDGRYRLPLWGRHNLVNAVGVLALLRALGMDGAALAAALAGFRGVCRRQQVIAESRGVTLVDDFGQHPTAVRETLAAVRQRFAGQRLTLLYRAESNTVRRRVMQPEFPVAMRAADRIVWIASIRKASDPEDLQQIDIPAIAADLAADKTTTTLVGSVDEAVDAVLADLQPPEVVLVMSSRALDGGVARLKAALAG